MRDLKTECRIAVVQARPVMFDKDKCVQKALGLIDECAANGAELIVFPELFIPASRSAAGIPTAAETGRSITTTPSSPPETRCAR